MDPLVRNQTVPRDPYVTTSSTGLGSLWNTAQAYRRRLIQVAGALLALALVIGGFLAWRASQRSARQAELREAVRTIDGTVGAAPNDYVLSFPTQADKDKAVDKALADLVAKYPGTEEGITARYFQGAFAADRGDLAKAEPILREVASSGNSDYAAQADLALADIYSNQGKAADAERLLKNRIEHPTVLVSKEQATFALARLYLQTKPQEARKLLQPLQTSPQAAVSRLALTMMSEIPRV